MTKKYLIQEIKHHIYCSKACYSTNNPKGMYGEFFKAKTYYDILCKFYTCHTPLIVFAKEVMGEHVDKWANAIFCVEVKFND